MIQTAMIPVLVVVVATLAAAVTDVWKFKVYNALTLPMLAAGVLYHSFTGGIPGLLASLGGAACGFGILILFYVMGGVGAGDVKLLAAVGAWLGVPLLLSVFVASAAAQAVYALAITAIHGTMDETLIKLALLWHRMTALGRHLREEDRIEQAVGRADRRRRLVPFAATLTIGFAATLIWFQDSRDVAWPPYTKAARSEPAGLREAHGHGPAAGARRVRVAPANGPTS